MRITEKVLVILFLIGAGMIQGKVPFGGVFTSLSSVLLALLYTLFGFALFNGIRFRGIFKRTSYSGKSAGNIVVTILSGIIIGIGVLVVLFNASHWPGAGIMRFTVLIPLAAINIMSIVLSIVKEQIGKPVLMRALPVLLFVLYYLYKYNFSYMM